MFILLIGGVETSSSRIINAIGGEGISLWQSSTFWIAIIAALAGFLATNRIQAGGFSFQASRESVIAAFGTAIYVFFVSDLMSIVSKVGEKVCLVGQPITACGWQYWVIWALIVPLMVGYGISLVKFAGGND